MLRKEANNRTLGVEVRQLRLFTALERPDSDILYIFTLSDMLAKIIIVKLAS